VPQARGHCRHDELSAAWIQPPALLSNLVEMSFRVPARCRLRTVGNAPPGR
jgi:hypothetical protein